MIFGVSFMVLTLVVVDGRRARSRRVDHGNRRDGFVNLARTRAVERRRSFGRGWVEEGREWAREMEVGDGRERGEVRTARPVGSLGQLALLTGDGRSATDVRAAGTAHVGVPKTARGSAWECIEGVVSQAETLSDREK